jgi:tetratricopeptide (TPR) repeat protein
MIESQESPSAISRDFIPELLRVVSQNDDSGNVTWNVLDSLEVLLDAGNTCGALHLAENVVEMLGDEPRNRLFKGYIALCNLMIDGDIDRGLATIEEIYIEIQHGGFSNVDRCWGTILLSRALWVGVYCRATPEVELFRARTLLSNEFSRIQALGDRLLASKVGLELAKSYVHCPSPEVSAAQEILKAVTALVESEGRSAEVSFDCTRMRYQVERDAQSGEEGAVSDEALRLASRPLGGVARGLAELSICRVGGIGSEERVFSIERALELFKESSYRSGEFESLLILANAAVENDHHAKAHRIFSQAVQVSVEGGFLYGRGIALLGAFQSVAMSGDTEAAQKLAKELLGLCKKPLFLGAFGLNVVAALQLVGDLSAATRLATTCEKHFITIGIHSLAGQASFMLGASHAESGKWRLARSAWKRALTCDELRRSHISACDKRAALAQAVAMVDFSERGALSDATLGEIDRLRSVSEKSLLPFGSSSVALVALARSLHVHAQLDILAKRSVEALKSLSKAREIFAQLGLEKEVALSDALNGLALLEASKDRGGDIVEEAVAALQRSLDYFAAMGSTRLLWKLHYYLTVAGVMRSQLASDAMVRERWRQMSIGWLKSAERDVQLLTLEGGMPRAGSGEGDFSPGLKPEVLEPLKQVLGLVSQKRQSKSKIEASGTTSKRFGRYLH